MYDLVLIGAGISSLMCAWKLRNSGLKMCIIESGRQITQRQCPRKTGVTQCHCSSCHIMQGAGGAGAFSDGKFIINTEPNNYGGRLFEHIGWDKGIAAIQEVEETLLHFGAPEDCWENDGVFEKKLFGTGLWMEKAKVRHLGTDHNLAVMNRLISEVEKFCSILYGKTCTSIWREDSCYHVAMECEVLLAKKVVVATGRSGSQFVKQLCYEFDVPITNNTIDIGVRVEVEGKIWDEVCQSLYEPKIYGRTKTYEDVFRTFCVNPYGEVVAENVEGCTSVNGHSYIEKRLPNTNFALLVTMKLTEPFHNIDNWGRSIAKNCNQLANNNVLVQRLGDLRRGKRSNADRIASGRVTPSLTTATPGDLGLGMPKRILDDIVEGLEMLDVVLPGTASDDTLLYGVEVKYYSVTPEFKDRWFEIAEDLWVIGDGSGVSRGLSQAGAMGIITGERIVI